MRDRRVWAVASVLGAVLVVFAGRYGWHRDELYFIEAGRHPAWGYADQPPLVPLLAAGWEFVTGGSLWLFRVLPALAVALVVPVAAATSDRLGGSPAARLGTAVVVASTAFVVGVGHLFSTATFTLLLTATALLLLLRALDAGTVRAWLLLGLVVGLGMQVQTLPALMMACCAAGLVLAGPREPLTTPGPWLAGVLAVALAAPNLVWQALNGWPQLVVAQSIAAGNSTSSAQRWQVIPFQLVIIGPLLALVLVPGAVRLARSPRFRWVVVSWALFLVLITATGGKVYYGSGFYPVLMAAGVPAVLAWIGSSRPRRAAARTLFAVHLAGTALISLPFAPPGSTGYGIAQAVNPDGGETVGWDRFTSQVTDAAGSADAVLTRNYGEAGALDAAARSGTDLPPVFSVHNAYHSWGPPPASARTVLLVGDRDGTLADRFAACRTVGTVDTGVDNTEDGALLQLCRDPRRPWTEIWPGMRLLG